MRDEKKELIISLETRLRAKDDVIVSQYVLLEQLQILNAYLTSAVELLSLPRQTDADVRFVVEGLSVLTTEPKEIRH